MTAAIATLDQIFPAGTWNADPTHSQVDFSVKHLGISTVRGTFSDVSSTLIGGETPALSGSIRLASVSTRDETRDAHLLSPDFFDTERYPDATFEATFVSPRKIVGDFTLKGVTKEIELSATLTGPGLDPSATSGSASTSRARSTATTTASRSTCRCRRAASRSATT